MVQRIRGRGDTIPGAPELLKSMGECRDRLINASTGVRPFGTAYHAIHLVTTAIDTLAFFITGQQHFYALTGSVQAGAPQFPAVCPVPRAQRDVEQDGGADYLPAARAAIAALPALLLEAEAGSAVALARYLGQALSEAEGIARRET